MRLIIFNKHDFEPMTVVDVPAAIMEGRHRGDRIRLLPRMRFEMVWDATPEPISQMTVRPVAIMLERMRFGWYDIWIGIADDDGLTLNSTLLPGQLADWQFEYA